MLLLFILNAFVLCFEPDEKVMPVSEDIVEYALQFLDERRLIKSGKVLDCSDCARSVFAHLDIFLQPSSKDQTQLVECTDVEQMGPGDLVFFTINGKTISHFGIYFMQ